MHCERGGERGGGGKYNERPFFSVSGVFGLTLLFRCFCNASLNFSRLCSIRLSRVFTDFFTARVKIKGRAHALPKDWDRLLLYIGAQEREMKESVKGWVMQQI